MATFQPLWETDPVQYLAFCKFPELAMFWKPLDGERRLTETQRVSMIQEADAYKESLWSLSDAEIDAMVEKAIPEEKARYLERLEQQEKQRAFNQPPAKADFEHWAKMSYWTIDEAVALSLGRSPKFASWQSVENLLRASAFAREFAAKREVALRAKTMDQLWEKNSPSTFLAWAERMRFSMPADLIEAVKSLGIQIGDWKRLFEQQKEFTEQARGQVAEKHTAHMAALKDHSESMTKLADGYQGILDQKDDLVALKDKRIEFLEARITGFEAAPAVKSEASLGARERESLLKLVIGMAIKGYSYNPKSGRSPTAKEIAGDLALVGIAMDEDTVRKYLAEEAIASRPRNVI